QGAGCSCRLNALLNGLCAIALCVGLYFIQHHKRGSACPTLDVFGCAYRTQLPSRRTACARALSSKGTALQGDLSLGRTTSRTSIPCLRSLGSTCKAYFGIGFVSS